MKGKITLQCKISPGIVHIGTGSVGKGSYVIWEMLGGNIIFKGQAFIGFGSKISVEKNGLLIIGDNFSITSNSTIIATKHVEFGDNCLLSWEILIMDTDFHQITDMEGAIINLPEKISIGNQVWIGCRCLILKGAVIPNNTVISANSLVNKKLCGENKLFGGSPAKELKCGIAWKK